MHIKDHLICRKNTETEKWYLSSDTNSSKLVFFRMNNDNENQLFTRETNTKRMIVFLENSERKIWGNERICFWENPGLSLCQSSWELRKQSIVVIFISIIMISCQFPLYFQNIEAQLKGAFLCSLCFVLTNICLILVLV